MQKYLNFDLDTNKLKQYYPKKDYTRAYKDIEKFLVSRGFEHRQGSAYVSKTSMDKDTVSFIVEELTRENPWLQTCCRSIDYTSVIDNDFQLIEIVKNADKSINEINK